MALSGVLSARHEQLFCFDARECRVETSGNDSLRLTSVVAELLDTVVQKGC